MYDKGQKLRISDMDYKINVYRLPEIIALAPSAVHKQY